MSRFLPGERVSLVSREGEELASGWVVTVSPGHERVVLHARDGGTIEWSEPFPERPSRWWRLAGVAVLCALASVLATVFYLLEVW